jgi:hypothetical protein
MRIAAGLTLVAGMLASSAHAVDGVLEINQTCGAGPGCFAGDTAGFPVQITARGSYRLTSNLTPPNQNVTMISINASDVTVDLNGFAIQGTNTFFGTSCSASGSGIGVLSASVTGVALVNGAVRGMGSHGVDLSSSSADRIDRVIAEHNCGIGIRVGNASIVTHSEANNSGNQGFGLSSTIRVSDCSAQVNGGDGINAPSGGVSIAGCITRSNGGSGMRLDQTASGFGSLVENSTASFNDQLGINSVAAGAGRPGIGVLYLRNTTMSNGGAGIGQVDGATGFNTAAGNGGFDIGASAALACNFGADPFYGLECP